MAQQTTVTLVDDLDGTTADKTVKFGLDRKEYEIDLSGVNAARLLEALEPFVKAARRAGTTSGPAPVRRRRTRAEMLAAAGTLTITTNEPSADAQLTEAVEEVFTEAKAKSTRTQAPKMTQAQRKDLNEQVRAWARMNNIPCAERGRLPASVLAAYDQQNGG